MKKLSWILMFLAVLVFCTVNVFAQDAEEKKEEKKGSYFTISTYKVNFNELGEFLETMEEFKEVITENEFILSQKVMRHVWGEDWTVVSVVEYEDFASIEKAQIRMGELYKEKFPDKEKRKEATKRYQSFIKGHYDSIVQEVASLTK